MAGQMWTLAATAIGKAIHAGDVDEVNRLVKSGENVHFKDRKQNTYLHYVCTMYRPSVFYALVAHCVDISSQNRHGNTPLHVTALQKDSGHVGDLMACGIDPFIRNKEGKMAEELKSQNKYWFMVYEKYKPGLFHAVKNHDIPTVQRLLRCWCRVDAVYNKQTLRQFAACLKFHDIVVIIDEHMATTNMIYGLFEGNYEKVNEALKKTRCRINFENEISAKKYVLQYAIKFHNFKFVKMLCDAGADVNLPIRVNNYFWGPLYFEALHKDVPLNIIWYILKSGADFSLKDERGRTAFIYALDKVNGEIPIEMFQYMLKTGSDITERDCIGCNPRDIARFVRRRDVVDLIDKYYVKIIRASDCYSLSTMAKDGYDSLMISHNYRDTFIYASGNQTDEVLRFIEWLPRFQDAVRRLYDSIINESAETVNSTLQSCTAPDLVINARNKARRTPLILAVIHARDDIVQLLLRLPFQLDIDAKDCCNCTAYHFACCLTSDTGEKIRQNLVQAGVDTNIRDVRGRTAEEFGRREDRDMYILKERKAIYGMATELICVDKYEEVRKLIRSRKKGLAEFQTFIREFRFPITALHKVLGPLMPTYRDLIFLAIDYGKQDIAYKLANLGAELGRQEKYERKCDDGTVEKHYYTPAERASHLGMHDLAEFLLGMRAIQLEKVRNLVPLLPKRALQHHFNIQRSKSVPSIFITQPVSA